MLPMEKSVTFTGACANEIIPSINRSFVYKAKEGRYVRIEHKQCKLFMNNNQVSDTGSGEPLVTQKYLNHCFGMFSSPLSAVVRGRVHVLFALFVFA
jgi:hypothetical protein